MSKNYIKTDVPQVKINSFNLDLIYSKRYQCQSSMAYKLANETKSFRHGTSSKMDIAIHGLVTDPQNDRIGWGLGGNRYLSKKKRQWSEVKRTQQIWSCCIKHGKQYQCDISAKE